MRAIAVMIPTLLVALGCGASSEGPERSSEAYLYSQTPTGPAASCPMAIVGTDLEVINMDDGVAFKFITRDDSDVVDLRNRTRNLAMTHYRAVSGKPGNMSYDVAVFDIEGGARIELRAQNQNQVASLQQQALTDSRTMHTGRCDGLR